MADHNKLEQVFLNVLGNARDALDEFETTVFEIKNLEEAPEWVKKWEKTITIRTYQDDNYVCVEIMDNAFGIHKSHVQKIFEPFFTTKEVGKGTGLGLSISYGIIKDFSGTIEVDSKIMSGSKFTVKLPICDK
jgi:signal transduction histidine kinase